MEPITTSSDRIPLLAALAGNDCVTKAGALDSAAYVQTHALQIGSPAIDAGSNSDSLTANQRGAGLWTPSTQRHCGHWCLLRPLDRRCRECCGLNRHPQLSVLLTSPPPTCSQTTGRSGAHPDPIRDLHRHTMATDADGQTTTRIFTIVVLTRYALTVTGNSSGEGTVWDCGVTDCYGDYGCLQWLV